MLILPGTHQEDHAERRRCGQGGGPRPRHHLPRARALLRDAAAARQEGDSAEGSAHPHTQSLVSRPPQFMVYGAATTSLFFCRKFCIQSEKRFDFLKDLVSNVPELQGDMDSEGLAVASATPTELRAVGGAGVGRGRGQASSRPLVPGTGKRRGRPPKALGAPPSARTKSRVERFVDDEYPDCRDVAELGADTGSPQQQLRVPGYPPQHRPGVDRLQQQMLHYNKQFSSPFSSTRSEGGHYPGQGAGSSCPAPATPPAPSPQQPFTVAIQPSPGGDKAAAYQRTNSLPPPAPVYTPPHPRPVFRSPSFTPIAPKPSWHPSSPQTQSNAFAGAASNGHSLKLQPPETNGNFTVSPLPATSLQNSIQPTQIHSSNNFLAPQFSQSSSLTPEQDLDEDYDC